MILVEDLFNVLPYGDVIDFVEMRGTFLRNLIEDFARGFRTNGSFSGRFLQVFRNRKVKSN